MKELKENKQRTLRQNKALHLYFTMIAEALNDAGYDMRKTLKPSVDIPWDGETVKKHIWKPIQKAQLGFESTTKLSTIDVDKIAETINRHFGEKFGVHVPFPSIELLIDNQLNYENIFNH